MHKTGRRPLLAIDVTDTGIGMTPETLKRVFDPFAQADTSITRRFGGTGLGLSISLQMARALGGGITVKSKEGAGSTFTLIVETGSLAGVTMSDVKPLDPAPVARPAETKTQLKLPPGRILLVDDGESNRKLISLILRRAGAVVETATNGQEGVDAALSEPFDVILMDMQMPVKDGYTAARELRSSGVEIPIIALTANAMKGDEAKCRAAGCSGFMTKPVDLDLLITTLAQLLGAVPETDAPGEPPIPDPVVVAGPLVSTLPLDDAEFREIVAEFVTRLRVRLGEMRQACQDRDFGELAGLAHWLKGSGGTAGFSAFSEPAAELEQKAREADADGVERALAHLEVLAEQIQMDAPAAPAPAFTSSPGGQLLKSTLPTHDPEFCEIVNEFIDRLQEQLDCMHQAYSDGELAELAGLAHWLKGAGGTAGFQAFFDPAMKLEELAQAQQIDDIESALEELADLAGQIERPAAPSTADRAGDDSRPEPASDGEEFSDVA